MTTEPPTDSIIMALNTPVPCMSGQAGTNDRRRLRDGAADDVETGLVAVPAGRRGVEDDEEVVLAPHHALGHPGGAAGVEQEEVVAVASPRRDRAVPGRRRRVLVRRRPLGARARAVVDAEPRADARHPVADAVDALGELAVEDDGHRVGVVPEVDELVVAVAVVRVDRHERDLERGEHRLEVLGAVAEVLGDLVLACDAGVQQCPGHAVGPPVEVPPREPAVACICAGASGSSSATVSHTSAKFQPPITAPGSSARRCGRSRPSPCRPSSRTPAACGRHRRRAACRSR